MQPFEYGNPTTVQEAVGMLGAQWGEADVLAGGTDLISLMKEYLATPKRVVNIKNVKELGGIKNSKAGLRIGATVTIDELLENADVRKTFPSLTAAAQASPVRRSAIWGRSAGTPASVLAAGIIAAGTGRSVHGTTGI